MTDVGTTPDSTAGGMPDPNAPASNVALSQEDPVGSGGRSIEEGLGTTRYKEYDYPGYVQVVRATVPAEIWSGVFYSWLSMKGHLLGIHDFDRSEFFVSGLPGSDIDVVFAVVFHEAESLAEWVEHGYPVDAMLAAMGVPREDITVALARDFS